MAWEIGNKAATNAAFWGLVGFHLLGRKGGPIMALTGLMLTLRRPLIFHVAQQYNLQDHKVAALSNASSHLIHAICCAGLYAVKALDGKSACIAATGLSLTGLLLDPSTRFAFKNWGSNERSILETNDLFLESIYNPK